MSLSLLDFPPEVFESIIRPLGLCDLISLRLSSRALATKTTMSDHFKSYFRTKHIDITARSLRAFVDATQPGSLGCLIQHLVLVGVVNNTKLLESIIESNYSSEEESYEEAERREEKQAKAQQDLEILEQRRSDYEQLHESGRDVRLLSEAFRNIAANSKAGKLLSLSLEVIVYRQDAEQRLPDQSGGSWKFIWQSAADTFHTTIRALAATSLPIEKLNIFNDYRSQYCSGCSLACNELGSIDFKDKGLATSLAALKSLSISVSDRFVFGSIFDAERSHDPADGLGFVDYGLSAEETFMEDIRAIMAAEVNFVGIAKLLQVSSQLEELDMHEYRFWKSLNLNREEGQLERLLQHVVDMDSLPRLKRLELRGLWVREQDLLTFVRRTGARKLSMSQIHMTSGSFESLFSYCMGDAAALEELYFSELFVGAKQESAKRLYFGTTRNSLDLMILAGAGAVTATLERTGAEIKQMITFCLEAGYGFIHPMVAVT